MDSGGSASDARTHDKDIGHGGIVSGHLGPRICASSVSTQATSHADHAGLGQSFTRIDEPSSPHYSHCARLRGPGYQSGGENEPQGTCPEICAFDGTTTATTPASRPRR